QSRNSSRNQKSRRIRIADSTSASPLIWRVFQSARLPPSAAAALSGAQSSFPSGQLHFQQSYERPRPSPWPCAPSGTGSRRKLADVQFLTFTLSSWPTVSLHDNRPAEVGTSAIRRT